MDDVVIQEHLENLDRRLSRVEQILPTLATKDDLSRFATKDDLSRFATKDDLLRFATKDDLTRFATKAELHEVEERLRRHMNVLHEAVRSDIQLLAEHLATVMSKLDQR